MAIIFWNDCYITNDDKPLPMQYVAQLYERGMSFVIYFTLHTIHKFTLLKGLVVLYCRRFSGEIAHRWVKSEEGVPTY